MKKLIIFCLSFYNLITYAQIKPRIQSPMHPMAGQVYYIDSIELTSNAYVKYMDPNDVENVTILNNEDHPRGAVYLQLKNDKLVLKLLRSDLLSLGEIAKANIPNKI